MTDPIASAVLRDLTPADHNLVRSEWLKCYSSSAWARSMTPPELWSAGKASKEFWSGHHDVVTRLLARSEGLALSWPEDAWTVLGFVVFERPSTLHWVHTLANYRRAGVATRLLDAAGLVSAPAVTYSHRSRGCSRLRIPGSWRFDPYSALL